MFDWLGDIISALGSSIGSSFSGISDSIVDAILNRILQWLFITIYTGVADFFSKISSMGVEIFELSWVSAVVKLFSLFAWSLFATGFVVSAFDTAVQYQNGGGNIRSTFINWIKAFMAVNLFTSVPIELYKFCISLQNTFSKDLIKIAGESGGSLGDVAMKILKSNFCPDGVMISANLFTIFMILAFAFCVVKIFFDNIKRGGILLIMIAVGSLYMFSIPRGIDDGFISWIKQVIALCLTAFLQTTLLFLGLITCNTNMILALGIMLAASEVPRIAQNFGLDTGVKVNMMSAVHMTSTAVNMLKAI